MHILHTESSLGWGGQEIRILKEAEGMRERGYPVVFALSSGAQLATKARDRGFTVYELSFKKRSFFRTILRLLQIIKWHHIQIVNTHSSKDGWLGGLAAKLARKRVVRTRHLSSPIRKGINSRLLYGKLADHVVTTSSALLPIIAKQAKIPLKHCKCVPTGVDPAAIVIHPGEREKFRSCLRLTEEDFLVGTVCVVRSWKGIADFIKAADLLKNEKNIRWIVVGGGHVREYQQMAHDLHLDSILTFTGHLDSPFAAIGSLDLFALLSTAHEGISQASLQAAYLERPLVTTSIGGLPEVCLDGKTGIVIPPFSPEKFAAAVLKLRADKELREKMGRGGRRLVEEKYLLRQMLDQMETIYANTIIR